MLEPIRCPGCAARYGLRPERVSPSIRRAKCVRCSDIFDIQEAVDRLLGRSASSEEPTIEFTAFAPLPEVLPPLDLDALLEAEDEAAREPLHLEPAAEVSVLPEVTEAVALEGGALEVEPLAAEAPLTEVPLTEVPLAEVPLTEVPLTEVPLTEAPLPEALDLVPELPEVPEATAAMDFDALLLPPLEPELVTHDALEPIEDLSPLEALPRAYEPRKEDLPGTETVESKPVTDKAPTLSMNDLDVAEEEILEKTLTDFPAAPLPPAPMATAPVAPAAPVMPATPAAPVAPAGHDEDEPHFSSAKDAISRLMGGLQAPPSERMRPGGGNMDLQSAMDAMDETLGGTSGQAGMATTQRLSMEELQAALRGERRPEAAPAATPAPSPALPPPSPALETVAGFPGPDPNLLKIKVGDDVYENVPLARVTEWIEQGRILEHFPVARQHSDNWIEAAKVPSLRPVFERLRRQRSEGGLDLTGVQAPAKRGLFSGLFGRN